MKIRIKKAPSIFFILMGGPEDYYHMSNITPDTFPANTDELFCGARTQNITVMARSMYNDFTAIAEKNRDFHSSPLPVLRQTNHLLLLLLLTLICSCNQGKKEIIQKLETATAWEDTAFPTATVQQIDLSQIPYQKLSAYGFFRGAYNELQPDERLLDYEPASSLFTDYAFKSRYIWIPSDSVASIQHDGAGGDVYLPEGAILIKNFYYPEDFRNPTGKRRIIETRLMVKQNGKWEGYPYVWNDAQTDADYKVIGAELEVSWVDKAGENRLIQYIVPNKNQCKSCHNRNEQLVPIGLQIKHLNHEIEYEGKQLNQLVRWEEQGFLKTSIDITSSASLIDYRDENQHIDLRAKSYLDINCGHCHQEAGPASTSGLYLTYDESDPMRLGVFKTPVAAGFGAGTLKFDVVPGKPEESILLHRMSSTEVGAAMPEIGRVTVHREGVELISKWIKEMADVR
jgi:uncharacterized repeat protein (TIGR03806 family)